MSTRASRILRRVAGEVLALALVAALPRAGSAATVRVFAAASLTEAFRDMATLYEGQHPGDAIELNFAGSQVLRMQIEQGARADVFASADPVQAEALRKARLVEAPVSLARNRLVAIVPADSARVARLQDLARPRTKVLMAGPTVPAGRYAAQVLAKLTSSGLFGDDYQSRVQANVVSHETSARGVLSKVALGEADAGFVYATDAAAMPDRVRAIEIPERYNVVAEYTISIVGGAADAARAKAFVDLVLGPEGQSILARRGFSR